MGQDNQKSVCINIYEGERKQCKYNFKIGNIILHLKNQNSRAGYKIKVPYFTKKYLKVKTKGTNLDYIRNRPKWSPSCDQNRSGKWK